MSKVNQAVDATSTLVNATASAVQGVGEGAKSVGHAVLETASSVANAPITGKVGGFIGEKFMQYWQAAEDITKSFVPKALDALLWVIRIDAITTLVYAWLAIAAIIAGVVLLKRFYKHFDAAQKNCESYSEVESAKAAKFFGTFILGAILTIATTTSYPTWSGALSVWNYVTVAKPELYLAKMAVDGGTAKIKEYVGTKSVK